LTAWLAPDREVTITGRIETPGCEGFGNSGLDQEQVQPQMRGQRPPEGM
jgi:hypothetical protein